MAYTLKDLERAGLTAEQIEEVVKAQKERLRLRAERRAQKVAKRLRIRRLEEQSK